MLNARVIFSKEFLAKTKGEDMKQSAKNNLYFDNLKKLDETGDLSKACTRVQVARMVGFTNAKQGYTWVCNAIRRGRIKESLIEVHNGVRICEYHYGKDALPRGAGLLKYQAEKKKTNTEAARPTTNIVMDVAPTTSSVVTTIRVKDIEITIPGIVPVTYVVELINQLNK